MTKSDEDPPEKATKELKKEDMTAATDANTDDADAKDDGGGQEEQKKDASEVTETEEKEKDDATSEEKAPEKEDEKTEKSSPDEAAAMDPTKDATPTEDVVMEDVAKNDSSENDKEKEKDVASDDKADDGGKEKVDKAQPIKKEEKDEQEETSGSKPSEESKASEEPPKKDDSDGKDQATPAKQEDTTKEAQGSVTGSFAKPLSDRDVFVGVDAHKGTMLLNDLIHLHYILTHKDKGVVSTKKSDVAGLAKRLTKLMMNGKKYELSGLKDVPTAFLKGAGRFLKHKESNLVSMSEEESVKFVTEQIVSTFKRMNETTSPSPVELVQESVDALIKNTAPAEQSTSGRDPKHTAPRPCDVLFLPIDYPWDENMPYEHQSGNKHLLFLASQHCAADTKESQKRVEAAFKLVTSKVEVNSGTELVQKTPRYVIQLLIDNHNSWREMELLDLAEFAVIFVFEVFLEKQIHGMGGQVSAQVAGLLSEHAKPGTTPFDAPTAHDVLFGRGGMTNGHPGNRRFRDIIALHRPDYIRATKMDKPNVARRIVRAIRQGNPMGRFLKKADDGKWYDVGDRCAAEKTSQGLRERSNAEKRQRSALREALRIRREDLADGAGPSAAKKAKLTDPATLGQLGLSGLVPSYVGAQVNYARGIPLSLSMKERPKDGKAKKGKRGKDENGEGTNSESLPPNAVDKDGNILVTDYDILCGRGGLTNHHKGNKRFRDIVALHRPDYVRAPKIQKPSVARVIVRAIRNGDPPGRFLRKDDKTGKWYDIGDKRAAEKTSQALREKSNEERERQAITPPFTAPAELTNGTSGSIPAAKPAADLKKDEPKPAKEEEDAKEASAGEVTAGKEEVKKTLASTDEAKGADRMDVDEEKKTPDEGETKQEEAKKVETIEV